MKKIKNRVLSVCILFMAIVFLYDGGVFFGKEERGLVKTKAESATVEVMDDKWTATPTIRWDLWNSMYQVTLNYTSAFNPKATWANDHADINGIDVRDYLTFNGETLKEIQAKGTQLNTLYPVSDDEGMIDNGETWNPVAACVNTDNINIQINRNYLAPGGLEFGIKAGFEMTNGGTTYKTTKDVMFKLIPDVSSFKSDRFTYDSLKAVPVDEAEIVTKKATVSYSRVSGWDSQHSGYICYHISSSALMNYGNVGTSLCDHNTYLNDYITINGKSLAYWNTVTYSKDYDYSGALGTHRIYATPTFAKMYQSNTSTTIAVFLHSDWMTAQDITDPVFDLADGMLYVGRDGATIYEQGTPTEIMNDGWTAKVTLPLNGGSQYSVNLQYISAFNPEATWANDHANINGIDVCDYLTFNGKTMAELREAVKNDDFTYLSTALDDKLSKGKDWNPVAVCVNQDNINIQINRNYLPAAGLKVGIKAGFEMKNNGTFYKTTEDVIFKLIPDVSNVQNLVAVNADEANVTKCDFEYKVTKVGTQGNYAKYELRVPDFAMDFTNNGWALGNNYTYLNDYITVDGKPLTYWNTVRYDLNYDYTGAANAARLYATPTWGQMHANSEQGFTVIYVYVNNDLNLTDPEIGFADGMLYPTGGKVYEYRNQVYAMSFVEGASVRAVVGDNDKTGIRFTANVDTELANAATEVGMFIVPQKYIDDYNESKFNDYFTYFETVKGKSKDSIALTFEKELVESGTLRGCIVGIMDKNWTLSYQAVAYYILDGEYFYSKPSDARSIVYVADMAMADTKADYGIGLKTALAQIVEKSFSSENSKTVSGSCGETFDVNEKFAFNVTGDTTWSIVSGTALTLSGSTATIVDSGEVTLRFCAYDGILKKDVTLTVTCQSDVRTIKTTKQYVLSDSLFLETNADIARAEKTQMESKGKIVMDNAPIEMTAYYHPVVGLVEFVSESVLSGELCLDSGLLLKLDDIYFRFEEAITVSVSNASMEDADAEYYTFADFPPRGLEKNLQQYFDLGFTTYLLTTDGFPTYISAAEAVAAQGKTTMVRNMGTSAALTNTWFTDNDRWTTTDGNAFTSSGKEDSLTKSLSELYAENKISDFYMADEYTSTQFDSLGDLIAWKNANAKDKLWHMNLVGSLSFDHWESGYKASSGSSIWDWITGNKYDSAKYQATYGVHVDDYINKIVKKLNGGTASVCLDCYPFRETGKGVIYDYYLFDLLTAATKTKSYNENRNGVGAEARFGICLQTYQFIQPNQNSDGTHDLGRDISSAAEISMQIYTGLAMGADLFEYFSYCTTASSGSTANGIVAQDGWYKNEYTSRGNMYDYVKTANGNALPFAKVTSAYNWQGTFVSSGSTVSENGTAFGKITDLTTKDTGAMTSYGSTYDALFGRYTQGGQDGYMVVNYTDPTLAHTNAVTMNFGSCKYAIVYTAGGEATVMPLTDGTLTLNLSAGAGAFVVPMA